MSITALAVMSFENLFLVPAVSVIASVTHDLTLLINHFISFDKRNKY